MKIKRKYLIKRIITGSFETWHLPWYKFVLSEKNKNKSGGLFSFFRVKDRLVKGNQNKQSVIQLQNSKASYYRIDITNKNGSQTLIKEIL